MYMALSKLYLPWMVVMVEIVGANVRAKYFLPLQSLITANRLPRNAIAYSYDSK